MIHSRFTIVTASLAAVIASAAPSHAQRPEPVRIGGIAIDATEVTIGLFRAFARANGAQWKAAGFCALYIGFRCAYDTKG